VAAVEAGLLVMNQVNQMELLEVEDLVVVETERLKVPQVVLALPTLVVVAEDLDISSTPVAEMVDLELLFYDIQMQEQYQIQEED
jgi:hypothetical protein